MAKRTMRIGGITLEVALGVFLVALLVSALNTPEGQASMGKSAVKKVRSANATAGSVLPFQGGTLCLKDDSNKGNVVLFEPATGNYTFCCNGVIAASGKGTVTIKGSVITLQHYPGNLRVNIIYDGSVHKGNAALQMPVGVIKCTIGDRNTTDDTCACPAQIQQME